MADSAPSSQPEAPSLAGLRIIDLTRILSGPFATQILGDLGAEVVKVETPSGDPVRDQGTIRDGFSWYFAGFNRNKKSVVIDLYSPEGKAALRTLLSTADVVVENFRPGTMEKMGFGRAELDALNPRLISASINGWGSNGPNAGRPAFDFVVQAMSGFMSTNGTSDGAPMRSAAPVTDLVAGIYLVVGILAALRERDQSGRGQHVEVAMQDAMLSLMAYLASEYFATGRQPVRTGNDHPLVAPYGLFRAADGEIAIAPSNDAILDRFLAVLDLGWVTTDPRYDSNDKRFQRRPELQTLIETRLACDPQDVWIERLNAAGVPCGKVQTFDDVFADPQVEARAMRIEVDHPGRGTVPMLGFPIKLSRTPCTIQQPAPLLGEHTRRILG